MTRRVLLGLLAVTVLVLALLEIPLAIFYQRRELERFTSAVERDASVIATVYEDSLEAGRALDPRPADVYAARTGARVVVTDAHGIAWVDTEQSVPRDFSTRPEMVIALTGERASGKRRSDTLATELVYVAVPVSSGGVVHGALRLTLGTADVDARVHRYWAGLGAIGGVVLGLMALVGWAIARSVTRPVRRLTDFAARYDDGDLSTAPIEDMRDAPAELRVLADTMRAMVSRLAALLAEQRSFVADASHQLRTPLTALRLRLENLQTRGTVPDAELEAAIAETERLAGLVSDLLQLARADEHRPPVVVDLARVTADRVDTWSAMADVAHATLKLRGAASPVLIRAVPGAVEQILDNTLDNALHAAPAGSTITIALDREGPRCRLTISDQGPGLSDADKERAIQRFWRGAHDRPGTGLGLSIADALAKASGGNLHLADAPDHGLSVVIEFEGVSR